MPKGHRRRQNIGYILGFGIGFACILVLVMPKQERFHMRGPMNTGHKELTCQSCHKPIGLTWNAGGIWPSKSHQFDLP
jgi:hypothetical protein